MSFPKNTLGYCLECGGGYVTGHLSFCSHNGDSFPPPPKPKKTKAPKKEKSSFLEKILEADLKRAGIPFEREVRFAAPRRYRFDFVIRAAKVAIEVEGGTNYKSRHTSRTGFEKDCEKYNLAVCKGWPVLRFTSDMVKRGEVLPVLTTLLDSVDEDSQRV